MSIDRAKLQAIIERKYDGDEQEEHEVMLEALPRLLAVYETASSVAASIKLTNNRYDNEALLARVFRAVVHGEDSP